ncbi:MAG: sigma-54 dependent transcriptional regulator [Nitrospirota bacterium]
MDSCRKGSVLILDDEPNAVKVLSSILSQEGYCVRGSNDVGTATRIIRQVNIDAVITDMIMPGRDGADFFGYVRVNHPHIPVIFLTAYGTVDSAVRALQDGAFYFFEKPPDYSQLKSIVAKAVESSHMKRGSQAVIEGHPKGYNECRIITRAPQMFEILRTIEAVKESESSVLICGKTGTGKELIAKKLHYSSMRREKPFVALNCAAIPQELIESELFGFEKGAFTGAVSRRIGKIEHASGGTLFLDEICSLALNLQAKLLRVLQENEIERLGSNKKINVEFRLISSTNRDLNSMVGADEFREDLFYRINVVQIDLPPLRERKEDIPLLTSAFLNELCARENRSLSISEDALKMLQSYHWPGNIRQLKNIIERAIIMSTGDTITPKELPEDFMFLEQTDKGGLSQKTLKDTESQVIRSTLLECDGNKSKAARMLGISRKALYKRLRAYGIIQGGSNGNSFKETCLH